MKPGSPTSRAVACGMSNEKRPSVAVTPGLWGIRLKGLRVTAATDRPRASGPPNRPDPLRESQGAGESLDGLASWPLCRRQEIEPKVFGFPGAHHLDAATSDRVRPISGFFS